MLHTLWSENYENVTSCAKIIQEKCNFFLSLDENFPRYNQLSKGACVRPYFCINFNISKSQALIYLRGPLRLSTLVCTFLCQVSQNTCYSWKYMVIAAPQKLVWWIWKDSHANHNPSICQIIAILNIPWLLNSLISPIKGWLKKA